MTRLNKSRVICSGNEWEEGEGGGGWGQGSPPDRPRAVRPGAARRRV